MPLFLLFFGILFLVAAFRGKESMSELTGLLKDDFTGPGNFFIWCLAIGSIAAIGYIKALKPFSDIFLVLIFVVLILAKKGPNGQDLISSFFSQVSATERG